MSPRAGCSKAGRALGEGVDLAGAVEQRVLGVHVEMDRGRHGPSVRAGAAGIAVPEDLIPLFAARFRYLVALGRDDGRQPDGPAPDRRDSRPELRLAALQEERVRARLLLRVERQLDDPDLRGEPADGDALLASRIVGPLDAARRSVAERSPFLSSHSSD